MAKTMPPPACKGFLTKDKNFGVKKIKGKGSMVWYKRVSPKGVRLVYVFFSSQSGSNPGQWSARLTRSTT